MSITCDEFKDSAAAFVMGILDEAEQKACADHLVSAPRHDGCLVTLVEARQISAELAASLPAREPGRGVWRAIEARLDAPAADRAARLRSLRELAAWFVAAAVLGLYLYGGRVDTQRKAIAEEARGGTRNVPAEVRNAIALLGDKDSRVYAFRLAAAPAAGGAERAEQQAAAAILPARASLIVSERQRQAVLVGEHLMARPGKRLVLWVEQSPGRLDVLDTLRIDEPGTAIGDLGARLFAPAWPARLLVSMDDPDAGTPGEVLLTAELTR
jgi:hypothetical protein